MRRISFRKKKIGLVLGSGGAKGLSHIGVIKALEEKGVPIHLIAGASVGALVGACYAKRGEIKEAEEMILEIDWRRMVQLADPSLALIFKGFVHGQKVKKLLETIIGDLDFSDLKIPLAVVATDVNTGEEVVIRKGSVLEAVRASISMPVIFMPVKFGDRFLMDGGVVNPLPIDVAKKMGATFIIASNVVHPPAKRKPAKTKKARATRKESPGPSRIKSFLAVNKQINTFIQEGRDRMKNFQRHVDSIKEKMPTAFREIDADTPGIFYVLTQAFCAMEYEIAKSKLWEADVLITPDTADILALQFHRGEEAISKGYAAGLNEDIYQ